MGIHDRRWIVQRRFGSYWSFLFLVLALAWFGGQARAATSIIGPPPNTLNDVFLVISNEGSFGSAGGGGEYTPMLYIGDGGGGVLPGSVTVINFTSWVGGTYPQALDASVHGPTAAGLTAATGGDFSQFLGHDFFFIGSVTDGLDTHLVLSGALGTLPPSLDNGFEGALLDGITDLGGLDPSLSADAGVATMSADDFFGYFSNEGFSSEDIFGVVDLDNPDYVNWQTTITFGSTGTGEASGVLFGFSPGDPLGTHSAGGNGNGGLTGQFTPVPEPGTMSLLLGAFGLGVLRRRRRRRTTTK